MSGREWYLSSAGHTHWKSYHTQGVTETTRRFWGRKAAVFSGGVAMRLRRVGVNFGASGLSDYWGL
jgi:hypothetical protein